MALPSTEDSSTRPRLALFPVVALLAGLVLVAAVCVLATANQVLGLPIVVLSIHAFCCLRSIGLLAFLLK